MTALAFLKHLLFCAARAGVSALTVRAMIGVRIMDKPSARSAHVNPTPRAGGVGIVVAFLLGISMLYGYAGFARLADPYFRGVILAACAIALVGFIDDVRNLPFLPKLAAQVLAALAAVGSGLYVSEFRVPWAGTIDVGWMAMPLTVGWILFVTNAVNFIDGLNGLAAGAVLVASAFLAFVAQSQGAAFVYAASMLLAAGVIGFLPFNFPRASIFMGDVGSQFCGFVLAVLGVAAARFQGVELSFLLVPLLLSGVLFDVSFTLIRRVLAGQNVAQAHNGHLYQVARRAGMDARQIAMLHWGFAALGGLVAIAFQHVGPVAKPLLALAVLLPQILWAMYVARLARHAGLKSW